MMADAAVAEPRARNLLKRVCGRFRHPLSKFKFKFKFKLGCLLFM